MSSAAMALANFNDCRSGELAVGHIKGVWRDLGRQARTSKVGLRRIEVAAGHFSTPAHEHGADEEIFFVLAGEGLLWLDGRTYDIRARDCIVHRPKSGPHTLRGGTDGLDVLVFGQRLDPSLTALPRAGVAWSFPRWVELGDGDTPFAREGASGPPDCPPAEAERPPNVVALEHVEPVLDGIVHRLGKAAGGRASGLNHVRLEADGPSVPVHCHSAEEEIFVVLEGDGTLELWKRGATEPDEHPLRSGDVVSRPAGTGVSHTLRPGPDGLTYLAYGTREPTDMRFYPQSGRVSIPGLGIALRSPEIDYLPDF
jgi:uncharacterized cupin superfamily protein